MNTGSSRGLYLQTCHGLCTYRPATRAGRCYGEGVMHPMFVELFIKTLAGLFAVAYGLDATRPFVNRPGAVTDRTAGGTAHQERP